MRLPAAVFDVEIKMLLFLVSLFFVDPRRSTKTPLECDILVDPLVIWLHSELLIEGPIDMDCGSVSMTFIEDGTRLIFFIGPEEAKDEPDCFGER